MANITIKNVPDELYRRLKESAERHHRSINSEAIVVLGRMLESTRIDPAAYLKEVKSLRARMNGVWLTDSDIDAAKREGRP